MEIEYKQNRADYFNALKFISRQLTASTRWRYLLIFSYMLWFGFMVLGILLIRKHYIDHSVLSYSLDIGLMSIAASIIFLLVGSTIYTIKARPLVFKKDGLYLSTQKIQIKPECLMQYLGENEYKYQWRYIHRTIKTKKYIYVFVDSFVALYIPRHAFSSEEQYSAFFDELCLYNKEKGDSLC